MTEIFKNIAPFKNGQKNSRPSGSRFFPYKKEGK
jgi:hypothetical protein